ncbi:Immediate early response gene 5-like protein [Frankliniella fusca]|uniref:Immediate early response gene 5-like protein n=1 Tax=Frankliniella fusca TaxID=407009 RepID=A0AAE1HGW7_9NEOP|nr:Immediate early response gene 5-like protein [Frankliniella fusca]
MNISSRQQNRRRRAERDIASSLDLDGRSVTRYETDDIYHNLPVAGARRAAMLDESRFNKFAFMRRWKDEVHGLK